MTSLRAVAASLFAFIAFSIVSALISANVRKWADKHGWDNFLVRWADRWSWERLRGLWWLWAIFGLSGGVALALWLSPILVPTAPLAPPIASPNPVHDAATKWKLAQNLHYLSSRLPGNCEAVIVRYQLPYSETYSDDIKEVLGVIEWKFHETFATEELPRGLSLRSFESGMSRTCLDALKQRLNNDVQPAPNPPWSWIETATKYMAECSGQCVEIDIGNDPKSQ